MMIAWLERLWRRFFPRPNFKPDPRFSFSADELTLSIDQLAERYIEPALRLLEAEILNGGADGEIDRRDWP
jgi:hypothetical protein